MSEHTPTPWAVDGRTVYALCEDKSSNRFDLHVQGGWVVAPTKGRTTDQELEANAAFIVRAVNVHDELVEALLQFAVLGHGKCTIGKPAAEMARVALAKARGETP